MRKVHNLRVEKGITLVALIITIIILVILAAVTIKEVFGNGFLDIAIKGAENYAIAQTNEMDKVNEIDNFIKDKVNEIIDGQGSSNSAPRWIEGGEPHSVEEEKTNTQITIAMTAEDDDGDNLTYIIKYWKIRRRWRKGIYRRKENRRCRTRNRTNCRYNGAK